MNTYIKPEVRFNTLETESFICASIQKMTITIDVDDYDNRGEEVLIFDSDY